MVKKMQHKLTSKQIKSIHLLAHGMSVVQVSKGMKLRRETIWRWKNTPEYNNEFDRVMDNIRADLRHRILHLVEGSINTVSYAMESAYCDPGRLRVALNVLKLLGIERELISGELKQNGDEIKTNE